NMSSQVFLSYAGHPPLLIKRKNEDRWQQATIQSPSIPGNIPLGILDDPVFDEDNIALNSGDWIFLYTDGVIETFGENGQLFGIPRLMNFLEKNCNDNPSHLKQAVLNDLLQFSGGHLKHDDMTFMAIKIH
ncbi:MAG: PP2C family protein-serine/threonine phosphatase, partial [Nitrospinales bacterium]